jgi:hypothetical protein
VPAPIPGVRGTRRTGRRSSHPPTRSFSTISITLQIAMRGFRSCLVGPCLAIGNGVRFAVLS